jgi:hypothetical protein
MDKVHKPITTQYYTPSSKPFRIWPVKYGENQRLWLLQNKQLRINVRHTIQEGTGSWRKLRKEGLHGLHSLANITRASTSRKMRGGHVTRMGEKRNVYRVLKGGKMKVTTWKIKM